VGSPSVFIQGIAVLRDGDPLSCGDSIDSQGTTVFCNGGGNAVQAGITSNASAFDGSEETIGYSIKSITTSYPEIVFEAEINSEVINNVVEETWVGWKSSALSPRSSNGFVITLLEEFTNKQYQSLQGIGATSLPSSAPEFYKNPLDSQVTHTISFVETRLTIGSNNGNLTLVPSFIPPYQENSSIFEREFATNILLYYGSGGTGIDTGWLTIPFRVNYTVV
jgi:hypothetical protein